MNNEEVLEKLRKPLEAERTHTRQVVQEEIEAGEKRVSAKIETAKQEIMATIERDAEAYAAFFHKTWELIEKHEKNLTQRVEQIEDHLGLTDPTKNN